MCSPRSPYYLRPNFLEIPTSTFLIPASSTTFRIFRRVSLLFVQLLLREAMLFGNRVVTLQLHPDEFNPRSKLLLLTKHLSLNDFMLQKYGGFGFRHFLKEMNYEHISAITQSVLDLVSKHQCISLADIAQNFASLRDRRKQYILVGSPPKPDNLNA